jgi:predicted dehydrogenase
VVGTGFAARSHIEAMRRVPGVDVAAIAGRTAERAAATAADLHVPRSTADPSELFADDAINVVHICTPNDLHAGETAAALEAGKHLL